MGCRGRREQTAMLALLDALNKVRKTFKLKGKEEK